MKENIKVAIVQHGPEYLNLEKSVVKAKDLITEAATHNADLVVFGETWFSGYPAWLDHCEGAGLWDHEPAKAAFRQLYQNSLVIPGPETQALAKLAKDKDIVIAFGANEINPKGKGNGTIFNSFIIIDETGNIANHHRKLMPTYTEKLLYGLGDGAGLNSVDTKAGRINGLICWEHWMPLARQTMHNSGEQIHIAVWPTVHEMHQIACRQYAFEGRCFVIAAGQLLAAKDLPLPLPKHLNDQPDQLVLNGGSCIIGPDAKYITHPVFDEAKIIYESLDLNEIYKEKMTLDVTGHYQREDVFELNVRKDRSE